MNYKTGFIWILKFSDPSGSGGGSTAKNAANGISYFGGYGFVALFVSVF